MDAVKKPFTMDFSDCSGGCNSIEHPMLIGQNQVHPDTIGFMLKKSGVVKYPGAQGLSTSTTFTTFLRNLFISRKLDTTETLCAVSGGVLSSVSTVDGSLSSQYTMGAPTNEAWACNAFGKSFVVNGSSCVKIEGNTASQIGISVPSGASVVAANGTGLPDGVYNVIVSYARTTGGVVKLCSKGQSLGNVTLVGGNTNRIQVTIPNSTDAQVNAKVVWIQSPSEPTNSHYFFYQQNDNTTTVITISSTAQKTTELYEVSAIDNGLPPAGTFIYSFSNRLWIIKDNIIYYSNKGTFSEYDLEVFPAAFYIVTPYNLTGIFSAGSNLYFNTDDGILLLPGADPSSVISLVETRWHFKYMRTVDTWNGGVIGVTNDGIRIFNGSFSNYDLGYPIKDKLSDIYSSTPDYQPCGFVYRRDFRSEYHLMFQNVLSITFNNVHAILNLDTIYWNSSVDYCSAWEFQPISGNYAVVSKNTNTIYVGQTHETAPKIYKEDQSTCQNNNCYGADGLLIAGNSDYLGTLRTREFMYDISAIMWCVNYRPLSQCNDQFTIQFFSGNDPSKFTPPYVVMPTGSAGATWDNATFDVSKFTTENGTPTKGKFPDDFKCKSFYAVIQQQANDQNFKLLVLRIAGRFETGNFI